MFGHLLSINPPEPELLFDIKREHKANSDYPEGYPFLHDFSHNGCFATYQQNNLKSPELHYNSWVTYDNLFEGAELKQGVWHITKLIPSTNDSNALFYCTLGDFKGYRHKFGIFLSATAGEISTYYDAYPFSQALVPGMNIVDLSNLAGAEAPWYFKISDATYNKDEAGNLLETDVDIYIVFFPILDESNCSGYGEYLIPKFDNYVWRKDSENIVISDNGLTVDITQADYHWNLRLTPSPYYEDDYIVVYSPEFFNISCTKNIAIMAEFRGATGESSETVGTVQVIGRTTGINSPFYGGAVFKETYDSVYLQFYFTAKGVFTMLPYNNGGFTVPYSGNNTNVATIQVSETVPFHDKCELQTLITKYRNTYKGSSILYRNEVLSTSEDLLGIYGFRLNTYGEDKTNYSHRHCIADAAQGRWKNLVSYCNNTIVTNQITDYELLNKDTVSAVVLLNKEITSEDCSDTGSKLFSSRDGYNCFSGLFYYLIAFKERLTPWQIAYYIKMINS